MHIPSVRCSDCAPHFDKPEVTPLVWNDLAAHSINTVTTDGLRWQQLLNTLDKVVAGLAALDNKIDMVAKQSNKRESLEAEERKQQVLASATSFAESCSNDPHIANYLDPVAIEAWIKEKDS